MVFPSPIYGASFKQKWDIKIRLFPDSFPSPIYGASFKLHRTVLRLSYIDDEFPSPIYGASFKRVLMHMSVEHEEESFRPLYTGLVSNEKS